jgi:muconolactone D-isomerase
MEFLVELRVTWPPDGPADERDAYVAAESVRTRELAASGNLIRLWRVPGRWANVSIWSAESATELDALLRSLPFFAWLDIDVRPLAAHPSDPPNRKDGAA